MTTPKYFEFTENFSKLACFGSIQAVRMIDVYKNKIFSPYELIKLYRGIAPFAHIPYDIRIEVFCIHLCDVDRSLNLILLESIENAYENERDMYTPVLNKLADRLL